MHDPTIPAYLESKTDLSEGLAIFRFSLAQDFIFKPGQYATLWLTHRGTTTPRPYSIASSPSQTRVLEFYINLVSEGHLTPTLWDQDVIHGLQSRHPDTALAISGPKGRFILDPDDHRDLIFVASGTGLAPFMSMIRKLNEDYEAQLAALPPRRIYVVHGVSYSANLGYDQELQGLALETFRNPERKLGLVYIPTISRPHMDPAWKGLTGRAEALFEDQTADSLGPREIIKVMLRVLPRPETHAVYVCGHPGTIDRVVHVLSRSGFKLDTDLKREKYYP